jgi:murein DD-endopeptidase MepM/ murein hydrolase activator NlpD
VALHRQQATKTACVMPTIKKIPFVSPIPAMAAGPVVRPVSAKKLKRLRMNWFVIGSIFGIGASFFMNLLVTAVVPGLGFKDWGLGTHATKPMQELANSTKPLMVKAVATPPPNPQSPIPNPVTYPRTLALEVGRGDTLLAMLVGQNVPSDEAHRVVASLKPKFNPGALKVGQTISVTLDRHEKLGDRAAVKELAIKLPNLSMVELQRINGQKFSVDAIKPTLTANAYRARGVVKSSFSQAADDAGLPMSAINELIKVYSYDVDFQREIHPGDTLEVLLDRKTTKEGEVGGYENLRYAALTLQGKKHEIIRFKDSSGEFAWYDGKGESVKKSLIRTPIDGARISSGFGMRNHPVLGYSKMHRGVDFAAPTGTPIFAAGDGVVTFKGWKGGYGNFVEIRHNGTYSTAYGHISRFGNIKQGSRVKQGQVIAYVGSTGMSTGPHLHYEVRANGDQVNPVAKQFNLAGRLIGKQLAAFKTRKQAMIGELASLAGTKQVASR